MSKQSIDDEFTTTEKASMLGFIVVAAFCAGLYFGKDWFSTKDVVRMEQPAAPATIPPPMLNAAPPALPAKAKIVSDSPLGKPGKRISEVLTESGYRCFVLYHKEVQPEASMSCIKDIRDK